MRTLPRIAFHLLPNVAALLLFTCQPALAQTQERVVQWPKHTVGRMESVGTSVRTSPVTDALEIVDVKVSGNLITIGKPFAAGEDWLKGLTFRLKNISGRTITGLRISLSLPETHKNDTGVGTSLGFGSAALSAGASGAGKKFLPDEELELKFDDQQYARTKQLIAEKSGPMEIKTVWVGITLVKFEDGTLWSGGCLPSRDPGVTCPGAIPLDTGRGTDGTGSTLSRQGTRRISGTVKMKGDDRRPVANANILVRSIDRTARDNAFFESRALTDEQGRWVVDKVPDGAYLIVAEPLHSPTLAQEAMRREGGADSVTELSFVPSRHEVRVTGADVSGFTIEVSRGGRITGSVTMEGGQPLPKDLVVLPERVDVAGVAPIRIQTVRPDGSFTLEGVPTGSIRLHVFVYGKLNQYYTKSATVSGTDLLRETLPIEEGTEVKGVSVVFSSNVATLSGNILSPGDGTRVRGGNVMLIPTDEGRWRDSSARLSGEATREGGYTVSGAPGDYLAVVLLSGEDPYTLPEPVIRGRASNAQHVTLRPGERKKLDVLAQAGK